MIINVENDEMLGRTNDKTLHITLIEQQKEIERLKEEIKGYEQERERVLNVIDEKNKQAIEYIEGYPYKDLLPIELQIALKILKEGKK